MSHPRLAGVSAVLLPLLLLLCVTAAAAAAPAKGQVFAVLVAGSDGTGTADWNMGYGFHSDTCAVYDLLVSKGIPKENIVTMFLDDVVKQKTNPFPGQLYHSNLGLEVYKNVTADYTGKDITPQTLMSVLKGDAAAVKGHGSGRVLNSTAADHVLLYFSDHGGEDSLVFPTAELTKTQLQNTIGAMQKQQMFASLTIMLDACYSGTMMEWLPTNGSIYAATAANTEESASSTLCPPEDDVTPPGTTTKKHIGACLAGEFTLAWTMDVQSAPESDSLAKVFASVQQTVQLSHVSLYGDAKFAKAATVGDTYGPKEATIIDTTSSSLHKARASAVSRVSSRDLPAHSALYAYLAAAAAKPRDFSAHAPLLRALIANLADMAADQDGEDNMVHAVRVPSTVRKVDSGVLALFHTMRALPLQQRAPLIERLQSDLKKRIQTNERVAELARLWGVPLERQVADYPAKCFQSAVDANSRFCGTSAYAAQFNALYINACAARADAHSKQQQMVADIKQACADLL